MCIIAILSFHAQRKNNVNLVKQWQFLKQKVGGAGKKGGLSENGHIGNGHI
jgi:hypothetical protein